MQIKKFKLTIFNTVIFLTIISITNFSSAKLITNGTARILYRTFCTNTNSRLIETIKQQLRECTKIKPEHELTHEQEQTSKKLIELFKELGIEDTSKLLGPTWSSWENKTKEGHQIVTLFWKYCEYAYTKYKGTPIAPFALNIITHINIIGKTPKYIEGYLAITPILGIGEYLKTATETELPKYIDPLCSSKDDGAMQERDSLFELRKLAANYAKSHPECQEDFQTLQSLFTLAFYHDPRQC